MNNTQYVSVHGGHSGQFCTHATDSLEEIVLAYIEKKFAWVGITEHMPTISDSLLYPDQKKAGLTPSTLYDEFRKYMVECRRLQDKYCRDIQIFCGIETETYSGYTTFVPALIAEFRPDYIVGSVHFVCDIGFDYSETLYSKAVQAAGDIDELYSLYFDQQFEMITLLEPSVVGHFDLIRIFDPEYVSRLKNPGIWEKIERNLGLIKKLELILDLNLRPLQKGCEEPYISQAILQRAREMDITVIPGDDSHGLSSVGNHIIKGNDILTQMGFNTNWRKPKLIPY